MQPLPTDLALDQFALRMADFSLANVTEGDKSLARFLIAAGYPQPGREVAFTTELSLFGLFLFHLMLAQSAGASWNRVKDSMTRFSWLGHNSMRRANAAAEISEKDWYELAESRFREYAEAIANESEGYYLPAASFAGAVAKHLTGSEDVDAGVAAHTLVVIQATIEHIGPAVAETWQQFSSKSGT